MRLSDLEVYDPIMIQCHDNPDADAIASGYGLYCYFKSKGKSVRLVYSGSNKIHKSNLRLICRSNMWGWREGRPFMRTVCSSRLTASTAPEM